MKFFIYTLGCKVNQYESEALRELFLKKGYIESEKPFGADVIVVNSCSVTAESDRKTRQAVRRFRKASPSAFLVLCGCFPEGHKEEASSMPEADLVIGTRNKTGIVERVESHFAGLDTESDFFADSGSDVFEPMTVSALGRRFRAVVKIEDGCNSFCSYCIIPYVRGRVRSRNEDEALCEIKKLVENGAKEIVLSGIHIDRYGSEDGKTDLTTFLEKADAINGDFRIRLSSIDPVYFTSDTITRLSRLKKLCPHFHISLQSGSDAVLKLMNRKYTVSDYINAVRELREKIKGVSITTDVITGFPNESESDFEKSIETVRACEFLKVHVFPYSERPGTVAASMDGKVPREERSRRGAILAKEADAVAKKYISGFIGKKAKVLVEEIKDGTAVGYTENYIYVSIENGKFFAGDTAEVIIESIDGDKVTAKAIV